jgi:hypothetical protein
MIQDRYHGWKFSVEHGLLTIILPENESYYLIGKFSGYIRSASWAENFQKIFRLSRMAYELKHRKRISNMSLQDVEALYEFNQDGLEDLFFVLNRTRSLLVDEPKDYPILADNSAKALQIVLDG